MAADSSRRGPAKELVSVEDVRLLLKKHVPNGIDSIKSWDDVEGFLEDHKDFVAECIRCTDRLNPSTVAKAAQKQFEASNKTDYKKFGVAMASAFSYIKAKATKTTSMLHQSDVVKALVETKRATSTGKHTITTEREDGKGSTKADKQPASPPVALPVKARRRSRIAGKQPTSPTVALSVRSRSRSPSRCAGSASSSAHAAGVAPEKKESIMAMYRPEEPDWFETLDSSQEPSTPQPTKKASVVQEDPPIMFT